jgi:hypothetical protein
MKDRADTRSRHRWAPDSTDEELMADLEAARAEDVIDGVLATAPQNITSRQAAQLNRLFFGPS